MSFKELWNRLHVEHGVAAIVGGGHWTEELYTQSGLTDADRIEKLIGGFGEKRVLEYGCGDGRIAEHVVSRCTSMTCADASNLILARCKERVPGARHALTDWPSLLKGKFDCAYAMAVAYHLTDVETLRFIAEMADLLPTGGVLLFDFCNIFHPSYVDLVRKKATLGDWKTPWPWVAQDGESLLHSATQAFGYAKGTILDPDSQQPWIRLVK